MALDVNGAVDCQLAINESIESGAKFTAVGHAMPAFLVRVRYSARFTVSLPSLL